MATRVCSSTSRNDVNFAINGGGPDSLGITWTAAADLDTVLIPAGSSTWTTGVAITKSIQIIGAGEGQTIITENMTVRNDSAIPLFGAVISKEQQAPNYSYRLSGLTILANQAATVLPADHAYIKVAAANLRTDSPAPYVGGCVSRVRLDHITVTNPRGQVIAIDSCLGVGDHITISEDIHGAPLKCFMNRWTPAVDPATGTLIPTSYLSANGWGSWADDSYFGTDKFFFYEDCNIALSVAGATNAADDERAARVVYRHNTITNGTYASHGFEGTTGVRARELYNNHFIVSKAAAQTRSGSLLYFNNKSTNQTAGLPLQSYRNYTMYSLWGAASGDSRYDINDPSFTPITGSVTAVAPPGGAGADTITVTGDLSSINLTDGSAYVIQDTDDLYTVRAPGGFGNDPGWQCYQSGIVSVAGQVITITHFAQTPRSAIWQVGHNYVIRKVNVVMGQCGRGKMNLLNGNGYLTYTYPATSGTKATTPLKIGQGGTVQYPRDPCYAWNNTDDTHGYVVGFSNLAEDRELLDGRDIFNLSERTIESQNVGYPPIAYTRATSNHPLIGQNSDQSYTPFTYPHPLASGSSTGAIISLSGNMAFGNVIIGQTPTSVLSVFNIGDTLLTITGISYPTAFTGLTTGFTVAPGAHHDITVTFTPVAETTYTGNITVSSDASSGINTRACSGTGVQEAGGGHGKGHKKGTIGRHN